VNIHRTSFFFVSSLIALACACSSSNGTGEDPTSTGKQPSADQISDDDDPSRLLPGASRKLADNIAASDVGQTFGTDDGHVPYPDTYWPFTENGIDASWNGGDKSPLEKYMTLVDATDLAAAKDWEKTNHGSGVPGVQGWYGHCPGWTGAAMLNAPIQHAVFAKPDGNGGVTSCNQGDDGCIKFEIGDINALMAEIYVDADSRFIGNRCDTKPSDIKRDGDGRITRTGGGCQGLNPGSLVIVLGAQMKTNKAAMAIDAQNGFNTDQIWNQPAYRYTVYAYEPLAEAEAANLVATGSKTGALTKYKWNDAAKGFARVDLGIKWVSERGANTDVVSGTDSTRETRVAAVLELDQDAASAGANIIGGEYLEDRSVGADRLAVPPFVWIATDSGPESLSPSVDGDHHNPYVKPTVVKALVAMGQQ
jgi:hypothetical protein